MYPTIIDTKIDSCLYSLTCGTATSTELSLAARSLELFVCLCVCVCVFFFRKGISPCQIVFFQHSFDFARDQSSKRLQFLEDFPQASRRFKKRYGSGSGSTSSKGHIRITFVTTFDSILLMSLFYFLIANHHPVSFSPRPVTISVSSPFQQPGGENPMAQRPPHERFQSLGNRISAYHGMPKYIALYRIYELVCQFQNNSDI